VKLMLVGFQTVRLTCCELARVAVYGVLLARL
jgi:hypothetical protein